jgi:hypothetical protein
MAMCFSPGGGMAGQWPPHLLKNGLRRPVIPIPATANTSVAPILELQLHDNSITANTAFVASLSQTTDDDYQTMFSQTFMAMNHKSDTLKTYIDSGASHHYFADKSWFDEYTEITPTTGHTASQGSTFSIVGVGNIRALCMVDDGYQSFTLMNVLHAPDLVANLISVSFADC